MSGRTRLLGAVGLLLLLTALVAAQRVVGAPRSPSRTFAADALLPPPPPPATSPCTTVIARPQAASVGQAIRGTVGPGSADQGPCEGTNHTWTWTFRDRPVPRCADDASTCILRNRQPSDAWAPFCINALTDESGTVDACDYVWILPKGIYDLSGTVSAQVRSQAVGVTVQANGPGGVQTTVTDAFGDYTFGEKPGTYTVTVRPKLGSALSPSPRQRTVAVHHDVTGVDFRLTQAVDELTLTATPAALTANGLSGAFTVVAQDLDDHGAPVAGRQLTLTPPPDAAPRALVCSARGLLSPTLLSDGTPLGNHFTVTTNSGGVASFTVWPGTVAGDWLLTAVETADPSVRAAVTLPFAPAGSGSFSPGLIAQEFYAVVRKTIGGTGIINLFSGSGAVGQGQASNQAVLLAFLETVTSNFPGADFGPVHAGASAGIVFYRHGTTDPQDSGFVLSVDQAEAIIAAAGAGRAIPSGQTSIPALAVWAASNGAASASAALGSLSPSPGEQYEYFGFPYPPAPTGAATQAAFDRQCTAPNPSLRTIQTHSPVALTFSGPSGEQFGLSAPGRTSDRGAGLILRGPGDETTYVVPASFNRVRVTATGTGPATIVSVSPGARGLIVQSYRLAVVRGRTATLRVTGKGLTGTLRLGHRPATVSPGLPATLSGLPHRLRVHRRTRVTLSLTSFGAPIAGAQVSVSGAGRGTGFQAITNARGHASLGLTPTRTGRVTITITAPGIATLIRIIQVRA